jgi:hypothetical protein
MGWQSTTHTVTQVSVLSLGDSFGDDQQRESFSGFGMFYAHGGAFTDAG